ncbi:hypothetical protein [Altererythrobacter sp. MF3-039]|uniref:hypothetical protein n=1 Tax=Altererythrobacter sp. MF3-039 TaxID=3252901 RepID=UPI00390CB90E
MRIAPKVVVGVLSAFALSGCAALNSVHWRFSGPEESTVFTTDAMQRHLIMVKDPEHRGRIKICAEASPDAMSVFTTAMATRGQFSPEGNEFESAYSFGQTASTIERTQTLNLLRESMFRTCERWLSGALTREQFVALAARDHRSMVAVLAIEQLTGVVKPRATVISGPAARAAIAQGEKVANLLTTYQKERADAEAAQKSADKALAEIDIMHDDQAGQKKKLCEFNSAPANAAEAWAKCAPANAAVAAAKSDVERAREREKSLLDQLESLSGSIASGVSAGKFNSGGYSANKNAMSDTAWLLLGDKIAEIALTSGINEPLMFCAGILARTDLDRSTRTACNDVISAAAADDREIRSSVFEITPPGQRTLDTRNDFTAEYRSARIELGELFLSTPEEKWKELWERFTTKTGFATFSCAQKTECMKIVADTSQQPFLELFLGNRSNLNQGMKEWRAALKENDDE